MSKMNPLKILFLLFLCAPVYASTFGETVAGGNGDYRNLSNQCAGSSFTITEAGQVTSITARIYSNGGSDQNTKAVIYDLLSSTWPNVQQGVSEAVVVSSNVMGWYTYTFSSPVSLLAGSYFLGIVSGSTNTRLNIKSTTDTSFSYRALTYATPENPFPGGTSPGNTNYHVVVYATYTPGAPPAGGGTANTTYKGNMFRGLNRGLSGGMR